MFELPPPDTKRWVPWRKAAVVHAVRIGMITLMEACLRYNLSVEEFLSWQRVAERHHPRVAGYQAADLPQYRRAALSQVRSDREHMTMADNRFALGSGQDDSNAEISALFESGSYGGPTDRSS